MSTYSTFGTFTLARMGILVSQQALNVTGNNIANINTEGYTRQELDQTSMTFGLADRYITRYAARQNGGVLSENINQLRDQYLDIRYRNESTKVGEMETKLNGLEQLADIFDEVAKGEDGEGVLEARFNDLIQQLENLSQPGNVGSDSSDVLVRQAAEAVAVQFNNYATKLATLRETMTAEFHDNIESVNTTLTKIRDLNESIRAAETFGDTALTQRDERNLLIDDLSKQIGINVTYEAERLDDGRQIDKLVITTSGEPKRTLVNGIYSAELSLTTEKNGEGDPVFDLSITQMRDSNGRPDTAARNPLSDTVTEFTSADQNGATKFDTEAAALDIAKQLNGNFAYTTDADGKRYVFEAAAESEAADAKQVIRRYLLNDSGEKADSGTFDYAVVKTDLRTPIHDTELTGALQAMRELLTEEGEYADETALARDPNAGSKRGIPYYQQALDKLANEFAKQMNAANIIEPSVLYKSNGVRAKYFDEYEVEITDPAKYAEAKSVTYYADDDKTIETTDPNEYTIFVNADNHVTTNPEEYVIKDEYSYYNGGVLFSNNGRGDDTGGITAANISIAYGWSHGSTRVLRTTEENAPSLKQDNIAHIITLLTSDQKFEYGTASEGTSYFKGTFQDMLTDSIAGNLAKDQNITKSMLNNYTATADEIFNSRDSVMGVDLNDEAMNMMMFQKAYSAACRLMTTYDSLLDKLINGTAV